MKGDDNKRLAWQIAVANRLLADLVGEAVDADDQVTPEVLRQVLHLTAV